MYYRGLRNLDATLEYAFEHLGLSTATDMVVTGGSLGAYQHFCNRTLPFSSFHPLEVGLTVCACVRCACVRVCVCACVRVCVMRASRVYVRVPRTTVP